MSEAVSALPHAPYSGIVELSEAGLTGMITLRGDLASAPVAAAVLAATGAAVPDIRRLTVGDSGKAAWMSPDELLLIVPYGDVSARLQSMSAAFGDAFATAADVSDARAMITVTGAQARDVLAKICPVDFADFAVGEVRRTRAAQVAAALWREDGETWSIICFRSVAHYMCDMVQTVARPGSEVGLYRKS